MNLSKIKERNVHLIIWAGFFSVLAGIIISFFLPYYLKEAGMNPIQIGSLITVGVAFGGLLFGLVFSRIQQRISISNGLRNSAFLSFFYPFSFFLFSTPVGAIATTFIGKLKSSISTISSDVGLQHNVLSHGRRNTSNYYLVVDSTSQIVGLLLSVFLISYMGFKWSFLAFSFFAIPAIFLAGLVSDKGRFKARKKVKMKLPSFLKVLILSDLAYWFVMSSSFSLVVTFLVTQKFGGSINWIAYLFVGLYTSISLTGILFGKVLSKFNHLKTAAFGMFILFVSAVFVALSNNIYFVLSAFVLEGIGAAIWFPSKVAIYWEATSPRLREVASGYLYGWKEFVQALGPLAGGFMVYHFGNVSPFYLKAIVSLLIIFVYASLFYQFNRK